MRNRQRNQVFSCFRVYTKSGWPNIILFNDTFSVFLQEIHYTFSREKLITLLVPTSIKIRKMFEIRNSSPSRDKNDVATKLYKISGQTGEKPQISWKIQKQLKIPGIQKIPGKFPIIWKVPNWGIDSGNCTAFLHQCKSYSNIQVFSVHIHGKISHPTSSDGSLHCAAGPSFVFETHWFGRAAWLAGSGGPTRQADRQPG